MNHPVFCKPKGHDGRQNAKPGENKRDNDIKTYVKARLFHGVIILVPEIMPGGLRPGSLKAKMALARKEKSPKFFIN